MPNHRNPALKSIEAVVQIYLNALQKLRGRSAKKPAVRAISDAASKDAFLALALCLVPLVALSPSDRPLLTMLDPIPFPSYHRALRCLCPSVDGPGAAS